MLDRALQARAPDHAVAPRAQHPGLCALVIEPFVEADERAILRKLHVVTFAAREFDFDRSVPEHRRANDLPRRDARAFGAACKTGLGPGERRRRNWNPSNGGMLATQRTIRTSTRTRSQRHHGKRCGDYRARIELHPVANPIERLNSV